MPVAGRPETSRRLLPDHQELLVSLQSLRVEVILRTQNDYYLTIKSFLSPSPKVRSPGARASSPLGRLPRGGEPRPKCSDVRAAAGL